jgi:hypothetical protein
VTVSGEQFDGRVALTNAHHRFFATHLKGAHITNVTKLVAHQLTIDIVSVHVQYRVAVGENSGNGIWTLVIQRSSGNDEQWRIALATNSRVVPPPATSGAIFQQQTTPPPTATTATAPPSGAR